MTIFSFLTPPRSNAPVLWRPPDARLSPISAATATPAATPATSADTASISLCAPDGTPRRVQLAPANQPERELALLLLPLALTRGETIFCDKGYSARDFALLSGAPPYHRPLTPSQLTAEQTLISLLSSNSSSPSSAPAKTCSPCSVTAPSLPQTSSCASSPTARPRDLHLPQPSTRRPTHPYTLRPSAYLSSPRCRCSSRNERGPMSRSVRRYAKPS